MKQLVQNSKSGEIEVLDVPRPQCLADGLLVKTAYSLISTGTEKTSASTAKSSLFGKAKMRPDLVKKVLEHYHKNGLLDTYNLVIDRLNSPMPLGYSISGQVIEVGSGVRDFEIGDLVACSGGGYAFHADVNFVPKNLVTKINDGVSLHSASYITLGAIAMQGIRQAQIQVGCSVVVFGLGLVGQLTVQILKASGCKVIGIDIDDFAVNFALGNDPWSADYSFNLSKLDIEKKVLSLTKNNGADSVIITASTSNNIPILEAGKIIRDRGRIVIVGATKIDIPRSPFYEKEIEIIFSRSYGPGRYDKNYEEKGLDYPISYVRWTENRNMEAFQELIFAKKINPEKLTSKIYQIENAEKAFNLILDQSKKFIGVVLSYSQNYLNYQSDDFITNTNKKKKFTNSINVGFLGLGNFAKSYVMPFLKKSKMVSLQTVCNLNGYSVQDAMRKFNFESCTTNPDKLLLEKKIDTVFISSRHDTHSKFLIEAIKNKKNVYIEKPIAIKESELKNIITSYGDSYDKTFMVGYNRRFSEISYLLSNHLKKHSFPLSILYRINAGNLPSDHWTKDPELGGGRIIGEVCHFVDYAIFLTNSKVKTVFASTLKHNSKNELTQDTVHIQLNFLSGAISSILYLTDGSSKNSKEHIEICGDEKSYIVDDFKKLIIFNKNKKKIVFNGKQDKGYGNQIGKFLDSVRNGKKSPIDVNEIFHGSKVCFAILESLNKKIPIQIN